MTTTRQRAGVVGVGYEGRDAEQFVGELLAAGVDVVVDVRLTPVSRKRGFSKRALAENLEAAGIRYEHLRALGNPKDNRCHRQAVLSRVDEQLRAFDVN